MFEGTKLLIILPLIHRRFSVGIFDDRDLKIVQYTLYNTVFPNFFDTSLG